ncbi:hypothetical protein ACHAXR_005680, partial [Thalassiosira sp. AJA248-18]
MPPKNSSRVGGGGKKKKALPPQPAMFRLHNPVMAATVETTNDGKKDVAAPATSPPPPATDKPAVTSTDAPSAKPVTKSVNLDSEKKLPAAASVAKGSSSSNNNKKDKEVAEDSDKDSITGEINKTPPTATTAPPKKTAAPPHKKKKDYFSDSSSSDDDDEPKFNFPKTAIKRPRNTASAEAYAKRMAEKEEAERKKERDAEKKHKAVVTEEERKKKTKKKKSSSPGKKPAAAATTTNKTKGKAAKSGGDASGAVVKAKHSTTPKVPSPEQGHVKMKHTPKIPTDLPPRKKSTRGSPSKKAASPAEKEAAKEGNLKSPPEQIQPSARKSTRTKSSSASAGLKSPPEEIAAEAAPAPAKKKTPSPPTKKKTDVTLKEVEQEPSSSSSLHKTRRSKRDRSPIKVPTTTMGSPSNNANVQENDAQETVSSNSSTGNVSPPKVAARSAAKVATLAMSNATTTPAVAAGSRRSTRNASTVVAEEVISNDNLTEEVGASTTTAATTATADASAAAVRRSKRKRDGDDPTNETVESDKDVKADHTASSAAAVAAARRSKRSRKPSLEATVAKDNEAVALAMVAPSVPKGGGKKIARKALEAGAAFAGRKSSSSAATSSARKRKTRESMKTFVVHERVEAKYHGRGKLFYSGTIVNVLPSGDRYDIDYDDGDKDRGLSVAFIRSLPPELDDGVLVDVLVPSDEEFEQEEEGGEMEDKKPAAKRTTRKLPASASNKDASSKKPAAQKKAAAAGRPPPTKRQKKSGTKPTPEWLKEKITSTWNERIAMLKAHKAQFDTCDLTHAPKESVPPLLSSFVLESRKQYKKFQRGKHSTLTAARISELEELGFDFSPLESGSSRSNHERRFQRQWDVQFEKMLAYKREYGDCLASSMSGEHTKLGNWVRGQRKLYNKVGREGFPPHRLAKLDKIGFDFNPVESGSYLAKKRKNQFPQVNANWEKHYQNLISYKKEHGNIIVGPNSSGCPAGLYDWIHCQRKEYKRWEAGDEKALMYDQWITKLNEVGFDWAPMKGNGFSKM